MRVKEHHARPCISCYLVADVNPNTLEQSLVDTISEAAPSVSLDTARAAAKVLLPPQKKFYQGSRLCIDCIKMVCTLAPCKPTIAKPFHPPKTERPKQYWCGTCGVLQYNWPASKGFRLSLKNPAKYECRACNGVHSRHKKLLVKFFQLVNPEAIGAAKQFVAYHQEHRICSTLNCRETAQVFDHATKNPYCLEHFRLIDAAVTAPTVDAAIGLLDLANEACKLEYPIECSNIFSPFPTGVDNNATFDCLNNVFITSWDLFYTVRS
jgi:hypothetical protein